MRRLYGKATVTLIVGGCFWQGGIGMGRPKRIDAIPASSVNDDYAACADEQCRLDGRQTGIETLSCDWKMKILSASVATARENDMLHKGLCRLGKIGKLDA
jgi:hypothetical protein